MLPACSSARSQPQRAGGVGQPLHRPAVVGGDAVHGVGRLVGGDVAPAGAELVVGEAGLGSVVHEQIAQAGGQPLGGPLEAIVAGEQMVDRVGAQDAPLEPGAEVVVAGRLLAVGPEHAPRPARLGQVDQPVGALRLQHHLHPALLDLGAAAVAADGAHQRQRLHELALHAVGLRVPHDRRVGVERRPPIDLVVGVGIGGAGQPVDRARGHVLQVDRVGHRRPVAAAGVVGRPHVGDLPVVPADRRRISLTTVLERAISWTLCDEETAESNPALAIRLVDDVGVSFGTPEGVLPQSVRVPSLPVRVAPGLESCTSTREPGWALHHHKASPGFPHTARTVCSRL